MKMLRAKIIPLLCLGASSSWGVIFHDIDTTTPLVCSFSRSHQNRVAVSEGKIRKVICPDGLFSFRTESASGQLFIYAQEDFEDYAIISVITDSGLVQDIQVTLEDKPSEVVILREPSSTIDLGGEIFTDSSDQIISILHSVTSDRVPAGYVERQESVRGSWKHPNKSLEVKPQKAIEGPYETIWSMEVTNSSRKEIELEESEFRTKETKWVYLEKGRLKPNGKTTVILSEVR